MSFYYFDHGTISKAVKLQRQVLLYVIEYNKEKYNIMDQRQ